tara:strand:+ start:325 stop:699 length:375 start_codon:yes stop_codon:yes gene_type:complete
MSLRKVFKNATKAATTWIGSTIGGPTGARVGAAVGETLGTALFEKKSFGSGMGDDFGIIDTSVRPVRFSSNLRTFTPAGGRGQRGYAKAVNFPTLNAAWDARLAKYYTDDYKIKKTITSRRRIA